MKARPTCSAAASAVRTCQGDNSVSSSYVLEPKVLALVRERFRWHFPYLERIEGVLEEVPRGHTGPPGPLGSAALQ